MAELILKNVDFSYGKNKVLQDINIVLEKGVTALLGPNGAGKTTLINNLIEERLYMIIIMLEN